MVEGRLLALARKRAGAGAVQEQQLGGSGGASGSGAAAGPPKSKLGGALAARKRGIGSAGPKRRATADRLTDAAQPSKGEAAGGAGIGAVAGGGAAGGSSAGGPTPGTVRASDRLLPEDLVAIPVGLKGLLAQVYIGMKRRAYCLALGRHWKVRGLAFCLQHWQGCAETGS